MADANWAVAEGSTNGLPLVVRYLAEMPSSDFREAYAWLTVISWSYSPRKGGMPRPDEDMRMIQLEDTIEAELESKGYCVQAVSRTGNGLREWSYYIRDRDEFIDALNKALGELPRFPIEINFYPDPEWQELRQIYEGVSG